MKEELDSDTALSTARAWLDKMAPKGAQCPCCTQYVKIYRRGLNSRMARALLTIFRASGPNAPGIWINVPKLLVASGDGSGDYAKLRFWELIEPNKAAPTNGSRTSGVWRLTKKGREFVLDRISLPSSAVIFNDRCLTLDGEPRRISEIKGKQFSYREIMLRTSLSGSKAL